MRPLLPLAVAAILTLAPAAFADERVFMLDNRSSFTIVEFYASPTDVSSWEEDILGPDVLPAGEALRITIADGRDACIYDLRFVFEDGDVAEGEMDVCNTGSFTVRD